MKKSKQMFLIKAEPTELEPNSTQLRCTKFAIPPEKSPSENSELSTMKVMIEVSNHWLASLKKEVFNRNETNET